MVHYHRAHNSNMKIIFKYLIAIAPLANIATPVLADEMELYCEGRHNDGSGVPVIQTHLWLKISGSEGSHSVELQGPVFQESSLVLEESPTELKAIQINDDKSVERHIVLNRQTLRLDYSVRTGPEVEHVFSGICSRYSPKI
jgi:hypothetical protein